MQATIQTNLPPVAMEQRVEDLLRQLTLKEKVALLQPGESNVVNFTLDHRAFAFYDPYQKQWVAEPGEFEILLGSSSRDIRLNAICTLVKE